MCSKTSCRISSFLCFLLCAAMLLCACGPERIAPSRQASPSGQTGEYYSADGQQGGRSGNYSSDGWQQGGQSGDNSGSRQDTHTELQKEFDAFCDSVFREEMTDSSTLDLHYTLLHPENFGIETGEATLGDFSLTEMAKDNESIRKLKERLNAFDRSGLTASQTLTYDALLTTLDTALLAEGLELYEQPLAPTIGIQAQLPILLAEYSFHSLKDVEDYLSLLSQIDDCYNQILEFENQKADAGLGPSDTSIDQILKSCESYKIDPETNFLTETFADRLDSLERTVPLTETQKSDLDSRHKAAIRDHFVPAYETLIAGMTALKGRGINDGGLCGYKDGKKYYEYLLKSGPGLSYSIPELKSALSDRMRQDYEAIARILSENPSLDYQNAAFTLTDPEAILSDLRAQMAGDFPPLPDCGYEIRYVPKYLESSLSPAFYLTAPLDDTDQNVIYINNGYSDSTDSLYTTLAHEGFPGHLYQTVYNRTYAETPLLSILSCSGANEGWATYVESCAGTFENGLPEAVGRYRALVRSFSLCVHGLLDIGINYDGWTMEQAKQFITSCFQVDDETVSELWQVMIDNPTNYLEYCGGYVEYMEMREQAEAALGERFSPLKFHTFLLDLGPVSFSVIRPRFEEWLQSQAEAPALIDS